MKRFTNLLILTVLLSGCGAGNTLTNTVVDAAKESINTIVAAKPECKDVGEVCNSQIDSINATCNLELDDLSKDVAKWKWSFWGLMVLIGLYFGRKVLK